jgi:Lipid A 3-O-deacylase (PagL)
MPVAFRPVSGRNMTPRIKPAHENLQTERDLVSPCLWSFNHMLILRDRDRQRRFMKRVLALAATIVIASFLTTSAIAQEQQRAYSEYTYWFDGAFENGHAFSSTVGARNYQLESRYERLIYWKEPFAVRWVFDAVPMALVGDRYTSTGRRAYSYGVGGSPIGAQVNFVHYRHVEPFLTSGGGFLYFNHRMFGTTQQFNFTAQLGGGVQFFTSSRRTAIDLGYKYHHISNANLANQNPGLDSHMLFVGLSLFR